MGVVIKSIRSETPSGQTRTRSVATNGLYLIGIQMTGWLFNGATDSNGSFYISPQSNAFFSFNAANDGDRNSLASWMLVRTATASSPSPPVFIPTFDYPCGDFLYVHSNAFGETLEFEIIFYFRDSASEPRGSDVPLVVKHVELTTGVGGHLEEIGRINLLKKSVVRADKAYLCCKIGRLKFSTAVGAILNGFLDVISRPKTSGLALALAPSPLLPRILTIAETSISAPATAGLVILLTAIDLAQIVAQTAAVLAIAGIGAAIGTIVTGEGDDVCFDCVSNQILNQEHKRQRQRVKILRRL